MRSNPLVLDSSFVVVRLLSLHCDADCITVWDGLSSISPSETIADVARRLCDSCDGDSSGGAVNRFSAIDANVFPFSVPGPHVHWHPRHALVPHKHDLAEGTATAAAVARCGRRCDVCFCSIPNEDVAFSCHSCDYDVCVRCHPIGPPSNVNGPDFSG